MVEEDIVSPPPVRRDIRGSAGNYLQESFQTEVAQQDYPREDSPVSGALRLLDDTFGLGQGSTGDLLAGVTAAAIGSAVMGDRMDVVVHTPPTAHNLYGPAGRMGYVAGPRPRRSYQFRSKYFSGDKWKRFRSKSRKRKSKKIKGIPLGGLKPVRKRGRARSYRTKRFVTVRGRRYPAPLLRKRPVRRRKYKKRRFARRRRTRRLR